MMLSKIQAGRAAGLAGLGVLAFTLAPVPGAVAQEDVEAMRRAGLDDGEILEVNQVCCYFNYVNRQLNGLGVTLEGDTLGYYSSDS